jgi:hypothetical protein
LRNEELHYLKFSTNYGDEIKDEEISGEFRKSERNYYSENLKRRVHFSEI